MEFPAVSYACGPQDIIADGHDVLAPVNNEKVLADRICRLIEKDKELRKEMEKPPVESRTVRYKKYHPYVDGII